MKLCLTLCDPVDCSRQSFPVLHYFPEFAQIHVHWGASLAQMVNNLPVLQQTQVQSLAEEDPPEKEMATRSSILAWKIPWREKPSGAIVHGVIESDMTEETEHTYGYMSIESVRSSSHLILCGLLLLMHWVFSSIRVFSNESALCTRWPKYWSFGFNISLSDEYSGFISFRIDWLDLLAVPGTLSSTIPGKHNSLALSLYGPNLRSIHDHWKNHSFDYMDLCWQSDVSAF